MREHTCSSCCAALRVASGLFFSFDASVRDIAIAASLNSITYLGEQRDTHTYNGGKGGMHIGRTTHEKHVHISIRESRTSLAA